MNIQQLSYFSTAVDTSSFKETAKTHFVTPAAISKALGDLESELGIKLFVKEGRAIVPTGKALLLKPVADDINRNVKEFERLAKLPDTEESAHRTFLLATAYAPARSKLLECKEIEALESLDKARRIMVVRRESGSCLSAVVDGSVDAALIIGEPKTNAVEYTLVGISRSIIVANKNNPLASKTAVLPEDLQTTTIGWPHDIRYALPLVLDLFNKTGIKPHFTHLDTIEDNMKFINENKGCVLATDEPYITNLYQHAAFLPFANGKADAPIFLAYKEGNDDILLEKLAEALRAILR